VHGCMHGAHGVGGAQPRNNFGGLSQSGSLGLGSGVWGLGPGVLHIVRHVVMMVDFTVVCDAPTGSVFDLARRITPERYIRVAG
jgi:hypothetical protein